MLQNHLYTILRKTLREQSFLMNLHYKATSTQTRAADDWHNFLSFGIKGTHARSEETRTRQRSNNFFTFDTKTTTLGIFSERKWAEKFSLKVSVSLSNEGVICARETKTKSSITWYKVA